jgi:hypothetical protein
MRNNAQNRVNHKYLPRITSLITLILKQTSIDDFNIFGLYASYVFLDPGLGVEVVLVTE